MANNKDDFSKEFTPQELDHYYYRRAKAEDEQEREVGRFQFNTVLVLATVVCMAFAFQGSPVVIGLAGASFIAWVLWFREGN